MIKICLFLLLAASSLQAVATAYYVSSRRVASPGNGTIENPWSSLALLNRKAFLPGDTIFFERGSKWMGSFEITSSGSERKAIVLMPYGNGSRPSISNPDGKILDGNAIRISADYIVIDGFYIHDCGGSDPHQLAAIANLNRKNHHITVQNCEIRGCNVGIRMYAHDVKLLNNHLYDPKGTIAARWGPMGIVGAGYNVEIAYNRIENFLGANDYGYDGGAIEVDDEGPKYNWQIHHNYSRGNEGFLETIDKGECGSCTYADFVISYNFSDDYQWWVDGPIGTNPVLENNTVIRTRPPNSIYNLGLSLHHDIPKASIKNNMFVVANGITAYNRNAPGTNNIFYCTDGSVTNPKGFPLGSNEIVADPKFVNPAMANYHLSKGSPAIDFGAAGRFENDLDGIRIPDKPDVGAYQFER